MTATAQVEPMCRKEKLVKIEFCLSRIAHLGADYPLRANGRLSVYFVRRCLLWWLVGNLVFVDGRRRMLPCIQQRYKKWRRWQKGQRGHCCQGYTDVSKARVGINAVEPDIPVFWSQKVGKGVCGEPSELL